MTVTDQLVRRFRSQLREAGLRVHSVSWIQGGIGAEGTGEVAAIEYRDDQDIDFALEVLSPLRGFDITRITPTRIFIGTTS